MRQAAALLILASLLMFGRLQAFDIGLVPLNDIFQQPAQDYGRNISIQASLPQVQKMRRWIDEIAQVPKGLETLQAIDRSGHKLIINHSRRAVISSGKVSAPMSSALIDGRGESVEIHFNFDIPDAGSHRVFNSHRRAVEYTAVQNLYHELAHAMHMMRGSWRYTNSERQAIEEENEFRRQQARLGERSFRERYYVSGEPVCPEFPEHIDSGWQRGIICF